MSKVSLMIARFPGMIPGGGEHPATSDWLARTALKIKADPRISAAYHIRLNDTPITMTRNRTLKIAREQKVDYVIMIDADMNPDYLYGVDPKAVPFFDVALNFMLKHHGPCMTLAPYCGPPPIENPYVFKWDQKESNNPNVDFNLIMYSRDEVVGKEGIEEIAAGPTGVCMIDMRALDYIDKPYFYYEWADDDESEKASTEDVVFTRDLSLQRVPVFCIWNAWAGHYKTKLVGRPVLLTPDAMAKRFKDISVRNLGKTFDRSPRIAEVENGELETSQTVHIYADAKPRTIISDLADPLAEEVLTVVK